MKRVVKEILIGAVAAICFLPASCSKSESSIEQVLERANAEYNMRNLPEAMDAAREAIDKAGSSGADSLKAAALYLAANIAMRNMEDSLSWVYAEEAYNLAISSNLPLQRCQVLLLKGKLCNYACISEANNRNEEGLKYLQHAIAIAKEYDYNAETAQAYYVSADILINMNRWNDSDLDLDIYERAGDFIAVGDSLLAKYPGVVSPNISVHIRYFRQGNRYAEAIGYCKSVIQATSGTDYLTLFQVYDHLTQLQCIVGDLQGAAESHGLCAYYTQLYMKQSAENRITQIKKKYEAQRQCKIMCRLGSWIVVLLALLLLFAAMLIMLTRRTYMLRKREADLTRALIQRDKLLAIARSSVEGKENAVEV